MMASIIAATAMILLLLSLAFHVDPARRWQTQLKHVSLQSLQVLPIAILLFLIIPRPEPIYACLPTTAPNGLKRPDHAGRYRQPRAIQRTAFALPSTATCPP